MKTLKIAFTIEGNQENPNGNPIPKIKKTKGQQWSPQAQRYAAWKEFVRRAFREARPDIAVPIPKGVSGIMKIKIWWADEKHADPESVFGSIADALFENDKHLDGLFKAIHGENKKGRVEIEIEIN